MAKNSGKFLPKLKGRKIVKKSCACNHGDCAKNKCKNVSEVKKSTFTSLEVIAVTIITALISLLMGFVIANSSNKHALSSLSPELEAFVDEYNDIIKEYYNDVDEKKLLDDALKGIINSLGDPYTGVVDDNLQNSLTTQLQGSYEGFGIEIRNDADNNIMVVGVLENTPASKAGIKIYDVITKIDGKNVKGMTTTEFANLVQGLEKAEVTLTVLREDKSVDIKVKREKVVIESVKTDIYNRDNKKIGYINISIFAANTATQFKNALSSLEKENIDSLIIDVRNNTGGHLAAVEKILSSLLDSTNVIYQIKGKEETLKYYSTGKKTIDIPVAVLINTASASASEMLAATLNEQINAILVGNTTFGKGSVQEVFTTSSGTQYKITTNNWLTPKGNLIQDVGVKPTVEVSLDLSYYDNPTAENDNQLQEAIKQLLQ